MDNDDILLWLLRHRPWPIPDPVPIWSKLNDAQVREIGQLEVRLAAKQNEVFTRVTQEIAGIRAEGIKGIEKILGMQTKTK